MKIFPTSRLRIPALAACFLAFAIPANALAILANADAATAARRADTSGWHRGAPPSSGTWFYRVSTNSEADAATATTAAVSAATGGSNGEGFPGLVLTNSREEAAALNEYAARIGDTRFVFVFSNPISAEDAAIAADAKKELHALAARRAKGGAPAATPEQQVQLRRVRAERAAAQAIANNPIIGLWHSAAAGKETAAASSSDDASWLDGKVLFAANGKIIGHPRFSIWETTAVPTLYRVSGTGNGDKYFLARRTDTALDILYVDNIPFHETSIDGLVSLVKAGFAFEDLAAINGNRIEPLANNPVRVGNPAGASAAISTAPLPGFFVAPARRKGKPSVLAFFENHRVNGNGEFWAWEPAPASIAFGAAVSHAANGSVATFIPGTYLLTRRDDNDALHIAQLSSSGELRVLYPARKRDALGFRLALLQSGHSLDALATLDRSSIRSYGKHAPDSAALAALLSGKKPAASKAAESKPAAATTTESPAAKGADAIRANLRRTTIHSVNFRKTPLHQAISALADLGVAFGGEPINFTLLPGSANGNAEVTLILNAASLEQALDLLAHCTNHQWRINDGAIEFQSIPAAAATEK